MRWNWTDHILRKDPADNCAVALSWKPEEEGTSKDNVASNDGVKMNKEGWNS